MKHRNLLTAIALLALAAFWMGCNSPAENTVDNELLTREQTVDLDDEFGGFNLGDESPNFADPMLAADYGPESLAEYDDPMTNDSDVRSIRDRKRRHRYLMITWGNLNADTTINFPTDWTGALTVKNGVVLLKRTIRFDARDEILPRTSRDKLEWISHTQPHFDGILVELHKVMKHDSTCNDSTSLEAVDEPLEITFRTAPLTVTITEEDLKDLHRVVKVDDFGNAVAFNTITVEPQDCPQGFIAGQWKNKEDRRGGIFRGKWISHNGVHLGYLRGHYGPNSRGEKVFFGKWIVQNGRFMGLLRGHYGHFGDDRPGGWFEGHWVEQDRRIKGGLRGAWVTSDDIEGGGHFRGMWRKHCPNVSAR